MQKTLHFAYHFGCKIVGSAFLRNILKTFLDRNLIDFDRKQTVLYNAPIAASPWQMLISAEAGFANEMKHSNYQFAKGVRIQVIDAMCPVIIGNAYIERLA